MAQARLITTLAIDVTSLEPYLSCGSLDNKAQDFALGSLVPNAKGYLIVDETIKKE